MSHYLPLLIRTSDWRRLCASHLSPAQLARLIADGLTPDATLSVLPIPDLRVDTNLLWRIGRSPHGPHRGSPIVPAAIGGPIPWLTTQPLGPRETPVARLYAATSATSLPVWLHPEAAR